MGAYQIARGQSCEANAGFEALQGSCSHACKHRIDDRNMTLDTAASRGGGEGRFTSDTLPSLPRRFWTLLAPLITPAATSVHKRTSASQYNATSSYLHPQ
jgi:hypothetical protein